MFLDAAYIAKFYLEEPDSAAVRTAMYGADSLVTSSWTVAEVTSALHRHLRQGTLDAAQFREALRFFREHTASEFWTLVPVDAMVLNRMQVTVENLPKSVFLRAGDAIQLASAAVAGEREIWTSDRHVLAAAPYFGVTGRTA